MNRKFTTFALVLMFVISLKTTFSQNSIIIEKSIVDTTTSQPLTWCNIGIAGKRIGTVSNNLGIFSLKVPAYLRNDTITISRIGYYQKEILIKNLLNESTNKIYLTQKISQLKEVQIVSNKLNTKTKGNKTKSKTIVLGISSSLSLGREIGAVIKLPKKPVFIKSFNFNIVYNRPDSAKFRLNIYRYNKSIEENILNKNIFFTIPKDTTGVIQIDLSPFNIVVTDDIFVSVEVVAVYSEINPESLKEKTDRFYYDRINISGTITGSKSFIRKVSLDKWEKTKYSFSPGFWLTVAY